jgi:hypothetical protein
MKRTNITKFYLNTFINCKGGNLSKVYYKRYLKNLFNL